MGFDYLRSFRNCGELLEGCLKIIRDLLGDDAGAGRFADSSSASSFSQKMSRLTLSRFSNSS